MEKLTPELIQEAVDKYYDFTNCSIGNFLLEYANTDDYFGSCHEDSSLLGIVTTKKDRVDNDNGGYHSVYYFGKYGQYFKLNAWRSSYTSDLNWSDPVEVFPYEKTVIDYAEESELY